MTKRILTLLLVAFPLLAQVSYERLLESQKEPQNWLSYSGGFKSQRHSTLDQITTGNVKNLEQKWAFQVNSFEKFEATPLVVDGVMYTVEPPNTVIAMDAVTGRGFWRYEYSPSSESRPCCGRVNRGVAVLGDSLFMGAIDGHLMAIDTQSGTPIWDVAVEGARPEAGYALVTAPLVIKDKVIIGTAGGEFGIRGFIAAFDANTGAEQWRFYTVPGPGEPGHETWGGDSWKTGGGSIWLTGSYDPDLNLTYWGVGNPGPDWSGDSRPGDNLYTDSVVALDADTGELKWHYQFSPHDEFDYDAVQVPVLADMDWEGQPRKLMFWANRNGFFYVLDRETGKFLLGKPFVKVTWASGFDIKGRPIRVPGSESTEEGVLISPGNQGGTNWYSPSYSPETGLFYIPTWKNYETIFYKRPDEYREGQWFSGGGFRSLTPRSRGAGNYRNDSDGYGTVQAIDPKTGEQKWEYRMTDFTDAGILTTKSGVLFSGGREGYFYALDAATGELLWKANLGGRIISGPITFSVDGKQYVSINAGNAVVTFGLRD
jgi:alcohol dehydrogenase (cytochrome c)